MLLPEKVNHMETIAVYWEEKIKIYGISVKPGLTLLSLFPNDTSLIATTCLALTRVLPEFVLSAYQPGAMPRFDIVATAQSHDQNGEEKLYNVLSSMKEISFTTVDDVHMISLHGPHFQDRFGIAEVAVKALTNARIPVLLHVCAGTSLQIIVESNWSKQTYNVLHQTFVTPTSV